MDKKQEDSLLDSILLAGLVDCWMQVSDLIAKNKELETIMASKRPICQYCLSELQPFKYKGYYDSFSYWGCYCDEIHESREHRGSYG